MEMPTQKMAIPRTREARDHLRINYFVHELNHFRFTNLSRFEWWLQYNLFQCFRLWMAMVPFTVSSNIRLHGEFLNSSILILDMTFDCDF